MILKNKGVEKMKEDEHISEDKEKMEEQGSGTKVQHNLDFENVKACVSTMLECMKRNNKNKKKKKKKLFMDEPLPVHMRVQYVKMPLTRNLYRFSLPHPIYNRSSDVCLIVFNISKGSKEKDVENSREFYENLLEKKKVQGISKVVPLKQLEQEYYGFEMKRMFVDQYNLFLVDPRISSCVKKFFGVQLVRKKKTPVPVNLEEEDLQAEIDRALSVTTMLIEGKGVRSGVKVGRTDHSVQQIAENITAVAEQLADRFPGGWKNIRSLYIHVENSMVFPMYLSLLPSSEVEVPISPPLLPEHGLVEDELSTRPGMRVAVLPSGEVILRKEEDFEEYSEAESEEMDSGSEEENEANRNMPRNDMKNNFGLDFEENASKKKLSRRSKSTVEEELGMDESTAFEENTAGKKGKSKHGSKFPKKYTSDLDDDDDDDDSDTGGDVLNKAERAYLQNWAETHDESEKKRKWKQMDSGSEEEKEANRNMPRNDMKNNFGLDFEENASKKKLSRRSKSTVEEELGDDDKVEPQAKKLKSPKHKTKMGKKSKTPGKKENVAKIKSKEGRTNFKESRKDNLAGQNNNLKREDKVKKSPMERNSTVTESEKVSSDKKVKKNK